MKGRIIPALVVALATLLCCSSAALAAFPDKPVKIIVPFNAGGETDISARLLAKEMSKVLGQKVVVQNIAGAAGVVGCKNILSAKPDGYTLGVIPSGPLALHPFVRKIPFTADSFSYVARIIKAPYLVYVDKDSPWNSFNDMIADMKKNPGKYFWASCGVGSVPYFAYKNIGDAYHIKARHVGFMGDSGAFQAMAGKRVQVYAATSSVLKKYDVKALAIMDGERSSLLPKLPTVAESGSPVDISQWIVLTAPKGVPAETMQILSNAAEKAIQSPEFADALKRLGLTPAWLSPEKTTEFVKAEAAKNKANIEKSQKK